jgi:hypothetical protein
MPTKFILIVGGDIYDDGLYSLAVKFWAVSTWSIACEGDYESLALLYPLGTNLVDKRSPALNGESSVTMLFDLILLIKSDARLPDSLLSSSKTFIGEGGTYFFKSSRTGEASEPNRQSSSLESDS